MNTIKNVYSGKFIKVLEEHKGNVVYEKAFFLPTVHVFPVTSNGEILFIEERRWETGKTKLMLPSGVIDDTDKNPESAAKREMEEEIAYTTNTPLELVTKYEEKGSINSTRYYFLARDVEVIPERPPEEQILNIFKVSPEKMLEMVVNGDFGMSKSVLGYIDFAKKIRHNDIVL